VFVYAAICFVLGVASFASARLFPAHNVGRQLAVAMAWFVAGGIVVLLWQY
jgi:hypothetical protein